jgi:predicted transposase YdaD
MSKKINEGNLYDKVFKENAESIFIRLIESYLGQKIIAKKALPQKLQKTIEREIDYLFEITLENNDNFLLHIEFQTLSEKDIVFRIGEYHAILLKKYKKRIEHFVIYLGQSDIRINTKLMSEHVFESFNFINLSKLNPDIFINSKVPEEILLTVLTDISAEQKEDTLRLIIKNLKKNAIDKTNFDKFVNQLWVLSRLRKYDEITSKIINEMPVTIDIKKDVFYKKGFLEGELKGEARGEAIGVKKGEAIGVKKGEASGAFNALKKFIVSCYENKYPIEEIAKITSQPLTIINGIIEEYKNNTDTTKM